MDLANFSNTTAESGTDMQLCDPVTGEQIDGVFFTLCGADSSTYRNAVRRIGNRRLTKSGKKPTVESVEAESLELLAACTIGWKNIEENGEPVAFTSDNVKRIYTEFLWIREQVDAFIGDRANFLSQS